jgi:hypothetical protein
MKLSRKVFQIAFGCRHRELSRVFTLDRLTYQVCLHCGQHIEYSWDLMRSVSVHPNISENGDTRRDSSGRREVAIV